ncbi:MAG: hypothetical protein IT226_17080 [Flavobacteriales bacterium]|nr:hypothetical protein [Flavobacteriales bacterium]
MRSEHADIERIEAYVEGRMGDAERGVFEERLGTDEALMHDLHAFRVTRKALVDVFAEENECSAQNGNVVRLDNSRDRSRRWAAAAAVVLLVGTGAWYLLGRKASLPELAERYAVKESPLAVLMTGPQDHRNVLDKSMQLFGAGRYEQALAELDRLPTSDTASFYAGLCAIELRRDPCAHFRPVIADATSRYQAKALYHLMLWQLEHEQRKDATSLLQLQLRINDHPYRQKLELLAKEKALLP